MRGPCFCDILSVRGFRTMLSSNTGGDRKALSSRVIRPSGELDRRLENKAKEMTRKAFLP